MYPVVLLRPVFFAGSFAAASALTWSMCRLSFRSMFARSKLQSDLLGTGSVRIKSGRATCRYLGAEFSHFPFFFTSDAFAANREKGDGKFDSYLWLKVSEYDTIRQSQ
jgi:hypothetical protein